MLHSMPHHDNDDGDDVGGLAMPHNNYDYDMVMM
jgi:hypothetical protein